MLLNQSQAFCCQPWSQPWSQKRWADYWFKSLKCSIRHLRWTHLPQGMEFLVQCWDVWWDCHTRYQSHPWGHNGDINIFNHQDLSWCTPVETSICNTVCPLHLKWRNARSPWTTAASCRQPWGLCNKGLLTSATTLDSTIINIFISFDSVFDL